MRKVTGGAAVIACGVLALTTACSSSSGSHPSSGGKTSQSPSTSSVPSGSASGAAASQLTMAQAKQAFDALLPRYNQMAKKGSTAMVGQLTVDAEAAVQGFGTKSGGSLPAATPQAEKYYVPRLTSYPRWFVVAGSTRVYGSAGGDAFVVVQSQQGAPWRMAQVQSWIGPASPALSQIAVDSQGYATAVAPDVTSLMTPPGQLGAQYTQLAGGGSGAASSLFAAGPAGAYPMAPPRSGPDSPASAGWDFSAAFSAPSLPVFALRTTGNGAVVFFSFAESQTWVAKSSSAKFSSGGIPLVTAVQAGLRNTHVQAGARITLTELHETYGVDPARGQGKISVSDLASSGLTAGKATT